MAVVQYLAGLRKEDLPPPRCVHFDNLQEKIRRNIYLELPMTDGGLCLLSPALQPADNNCEARIQKLIEDNSSILLYLRERLVENLILDSAVLERSSYFLSQNNGLLLARLKYFNELEKVMELKLYTAPLKDINLHYSDKIYIGRCFMSLERRELPYKGLNLYVLSLMDQYEVLKTKSVGRLDHPEKYEKTYFQEIPELIQEVVSEVIRAIDTIPPKFRPTKWDVAEMIRVKAAYRSILHLLLELAEEVVEFESVLNFNDEDKFARYVTKFKKDLKNIIFFINFNILSELTHRINVGK